MSEQAPGSDAPTLSPGLRTGLYVGCFVLDGLALIAFALLALFELVDATTATAGAGIVFGATGFVASGLGIAYRPTRPDILPAGGPLVVPSGTGRHRAEEPVEDEPEPRYREE